MLIPLDLMILRITSGAYTYLILTMQAAVISNTFINTEERNPNRKDSPVNNLWHFWVQCVMLEFKKCINLHDRRDKILHNVSLFILYLELFRVVSQSEERSGRPIIIEKHNDPVNSKAAEKSTTSEFQSAVVNKETSDTSKGSTSDDETADDFYHLKPDFDFNSPFGEYGIGVYGQRSSKQHQNHQHHQSRRYHQHHHLHRSPSPGYRAQPSMRRGYKPGHVHRGDREVTEVPDPKVKIINHQIKAMAIMYRGKTTTIPNQRIGMATTEKETGTRIGVSKETTKQHYPEHNNDAYKKKQHDSHQVNPYSHKTDYVIQHSINSFGRQPHARFDPNKEGTFVSLNSLQDCMQ